MPARQRSNSALEEKLIDSYVQSTVELKSNVRFVEEKTLTGENLGASVVLVGPLEELSNSSVASLPFYSAAVAEGIKRLEEGKSTTLLSELSGTGKYISVVLCAVSKKASRNNCPYRPECYGAAVKAGISAAPGKDEKTVSVFVRAPAEGDLSIAAAIARCGPHSFSEASEAANSSFLNQKVKIQVAFAAHQASFEELERLATSVQLCQRLVDAPTDILDTVVFAEIAEAYGAALGASVKVIRGEELREQGYGGIYSVGKCAEYGPALVTLHFSNPKAVNGKNVALVGKGLVYDCGGLSLKTPTTVMCNMKTDMGGAGAVLAGFVAVVRAIKAGATSYKHIGNLSVTLCMADNAIGPRAYRNDDILRMKSGKTVEVANTDAEGRICLGDGVFHATNEQSFVPDVLIDMATLTGAQGIATGQRHAAIYSNNEEEERKFVEAGRLGGDTCFPVLYCPEYHAEEFKSVHADMRNIMKTHTNASVSCAGYFVESHISTKFTGAHIHVDLAYPSSNPEGATGYGVSLVTEYLKTISH